MKTIEIQTQKEFDELPDSLEVLTKIKITGNLSYINRNIKNGYTSVSGSATIKSVYGSATIEYVSGSATIKSVSGSATIESVSMNTIIRIVDDRVNIKEAQQEAVLVYQNCKGSPKKKDKTVIINHTKTAKFNLENFINIYNVPQKGTKLTLFKIVQNDYTDFHTGQIKYKIGATVTCPDWNPDQKIECGAGLHLSPSPHYCKRFNKPGKILKCEVDVKDIVVHPNPQYPYKVRCKKVKVVEEIKE